MNVEKAYYKPNNKNLFMFTFNGFGSAIQRPTQGTKILKKNK